MRRGRTNDLEENIDPSRANRSRRFSALTLISFILCLVSAIAVVRSFWFHESIGVRSPMGEVSVWSAFARFQFELTRAPSWDPDRPRQRWEISPQSFRLASG